MRPINKTKGKGPTDGGHTVRTVLSITAKAYDEATHTTHATGQHGARERQSINQ